MSKDNLSYLCDSLETMRDFVQSFKRDVHRLTIWDLVPFLSRKDISNILTDINLIDKDSIKIIDNGMYQNRNENNNLVDVIRNINRAFLSGKTVVVKNLETYNRAINSVCNAIGNNVDAHMYISPCKDATGFGMHSDDRDVFVIMLYGEKTFFTEGQRFDLKQEDILFIRQGILHSAKATGPSCHISLGLPSKMVNEYSASVTVPINLPF